MARAAAQIGLTPNTISLLSIVFSGLALLLYLAAPDFSPGLGNVACWVGAAACIQLRLLCNLLDGMVAVEGGKGTATGPVFNEVPDRIADVLILVGAGYSTTVEPGVIKLLGALPLGWSCAVLAMGTAYLRLLQGTLTGKQSFMGPMAKQHRMAVLTGGTLVAAMEVAFGNDTIWGISAALTIIFFGTIITCGLRLALIFRQIAQPGV